jgi:hypothetical protein
MPQDDGNDHHAITRRHAAWRAVGRHIPPDRESVGGSVVTVDVLPGGRDRFRPQSARRRENRRRPAAASPSHSPAVTVTVEVTLRGDTRYGDVLDVLEALRRVTDRLGKADVEIAPADASLTAEPESSAGLDRDDQAVLIFADSREVRLGEESIAFTRVEFDLLLHLAAHPRQVFTRGQLLQAVWGFGHAGQRTVDVHIRRLRAKLGEMPVVTTVRGVGYRLTDGAGIRIVRLP